MPISSLPLPCRARKIQSPCGLLRCQARRPLSGLFAIPRGNLRHAEWQQQCIFKKEGKDLHGFREQNSFSKPFKNDFYFLMPFFFKKENKNCVLRFLILPC
ncbi:hypothetical protein CEXT_443821 [Caerostris extrusa]|uniref:Uncharacterized protein n=1 Tax=Caerostris extrusa TaxID=172846 RepID=A0AAV4N478_CAEEX|nr:hypothetical protein CEXT_443821 [Caerostris extrusa]